MEEYTFKDLKGNLRTIKVGDKVLYATGEIGFIKSICDCSECLKRGFCEPRVEYMSSENLLQTDYMTNYAFEDNFENYYKIGNEIFNEKPSNEKIDEQINQCNIKIKTLQDWVKHLENFKNEV
jgi:hypothetical protein